MDPINFEKAHSQYAHKTQKHMKNPINFEKVRSQYAFSQKRGLHFIMASVVIWILIAIIHATSLPIETKDLLTFCCACPLMPLAWAFSKVLKVTFSDKGNPLSSLGIILSCAQIPYLLIVMWGMSSVPELMVMLFAMVFGAHLLPFGWFYRSGAYYVMSGVIPVGALLLGLLTSPLVLSLAMIGVEGIFCLLLYLECRKSPVSSKGQGTGER